MVIDRNDNGIYEKGAPPVSLSKIRNLATIIITVAKSKKNNQFQWSIQSIPDLQRA